MKLKILLFCILFLTLLLSPNPVYAVDCASIPISGSYTVTSTCNFPSTANGVDAGSGTTNTASITVNSGASLTVDAGQSVAFGRDASNVGIKINGSLNIVNTGSLKQNPVWMTDADADNYPDSLTHILQSTQPTNGKRRSLMIGINGSFLNHLKLDCSTTVSGTCPVNFTAAPTGTLSQTSINLSWTAISDATSYNLHRCSGSGCAIPSTATVTGITTTTFNDTGLACATLYRYAIKAVNSAGSSDLSTIYEATTTDTGTNQLLGCNYSGMNFNTLDGVAPSGPTLPNPANTATGLDINWGTGGPAGVGTNQFSIRWKGTFGFDAGSYSFRTGSDDGIKLFIDGTLVINKWADRGFPSSLDGATVSLSAGNHTIQVEYYENGGDARVLVSWSPGTYSQASYYGEANYIY